MKVVFWIYLGILILTSPLFIYDMYVERRLNFTFALQLVIITVAYFQIFKGEKKEESSDEE